MEGPGTAIKPRIRSWASIVMKSVISTIMLRECEKLHTYWLALHSLRLHTSLRLSPVYIYDGTAGVLESKWDQFLSLNSLHCSYSFVVLVRLATAISWHSVAAAVGYSGDLYLSDAGVPRYHPCIRVWELSTVWNSRLEYHFLIEFI